MKLNRRNIIKAMGVGAVAPVLGANQKTIEKKEEQFSFAFITDAHLTWALGQVRDRELPAPRKELLPAPFKGYERVMKELKKHSPDFVLTGGDGLELKVSKDAPQEPLPQFLTQVEGCVKQMKTVEATLGVPFYNTLGNHDTFEYAPVVPSHPLYAQGLFKKYLGYKGRSYYSFEQKGWHFIVLSTHDQKNGKNWAGFSAKQIDWLKKDLEQLPTETPIVISAHVPFPHSGGAFKADSKKIFQCLENYNVKLMLFGHTHSYEEFEWNGIPCVVGSSLSGAVWSGTRRVHDTIYGGKTAAHGQGYLILNVKGDSIDWKHYPFNYDIEKYQYETTGVKPYAVSKYWFLKETGRKKL